MESSNFVRAPVWDSKFALRTIKYQRSVISNICDYELVGREVRNGDHIISLSREYFLQRAYRSLRSKEYSPSIINVKLGR